MSQKQQQQQQHELVVWQCHPSGALQPLSLDQIHVVGGGDRTEQEVLKRLVHQEMDRYTTTVKSNNNNNNNSETKNPSSGEAIQRVLKGAVRALVKHHERKQTQQQPLQPSSSDGDASESELLEASENATTLLGLECVILSPQHGGVHQLTSLEIASLLSQCQE
jgi:hypothetical protein